MIKMLEILGEFPKRPCQIQLQVRARGWQLIILGGVVQIFMVIQQCFIGEPPVVHFLSETSIFLFHHAPPDDASVFVYIQ